MNAPRIVRGAFCMVGYEHRNHDAQHCDELNAPDAQHAERDACEGAGGRHDVT